MFKRINSLQFVKFKTYKIRNFSVEKNQHVSQFIKKYNSDYNSDYDLPQKEKKEREKMHDISYEKPHLLRYVINQIDKTGKLAIEKDPHVLKYIINQTDEICKLAIEKDPYALQFVKFQTDEICKLAIEKRSICTTICEIPNG